MLVIKNTKVILEDGIIWDGVVVCDGDQITEVGEAANVTIPEGAEVIDAGGKYTAPGFVDIHCHGGNMKFFFEDPSVAAEVHFAHGTTTLLPALYQTLTYEQFLEAVDKIREAKKHGAGRIIAGLYMEGPFMNPKYGSDTKNSKWRGAIDVDVMKSLVDYVGQDAMVWCVAPEREDIEIFCKYAKSVNPNVRFSMAHTECKPWQAYRLKKYGLVNQTHHCNATGVVNPIVPSNVGIRDVGPDEACLYDDDIYAELICDSMAIHVKPHMLRMVVKIKGIDKVILVTDHYPENCDNPTGPIWGGKKADDLGYVSSGEVCGSLMTLNVACRNMMKHSGYGLCHVIKFATINPARMLGIDESVGSIEKGKKANLVIIDDMVNVEKVIFEGAVQ
jgi:N-acetylglucosamine-6-phosphate deacetylase